MLYQIIYVSSAVDALDRQTYESIAAKAVEFNKSVQISGMMILYNGAIIQVLEGEKAEITELYDRITIDQRHKNPIKLFGGPIESRDFPNWSMGFEHATQDNESEHIFRIKSRIPEDRIPETICPHTQALLKSFKRVSGLEVSI